MTKILDQVCHLNYVPLTKLFNLIIHYFSDLWDKVIKSFILSVKIFIEHSRYIKHLNRAHLIALRMTRVWFSWSTLSNEKRIRKLTVLSRKYYEERKTR